MTPQPTTLTLRPSPYVFVTIVFVILKLTGAIDWPGGWCLLHYGCHWWWSWEWYCSLC